MKENSSAQGFDQHRTTSKPDIEINAWTVTKTLGKWAFGSLPLTTKLTAALFVAIPTACAALDLRFLDIRASRTSSETDGENDDDYDFWDEFTIW